MTKYHARPVDADGHHFDSLAEYNRWLELCILERAGSITKLEVHPKYEIIPAFTRDGKRERATYYEADFRYWDEALGRTTIEDVKGMRLPVYRLKRKLFLYLYPNVYFVEVNV